MWAKGFELCASVYSMYLCEITDKVTYSQVHSSSVLKVLPFKSLNRISATTFVELLQFYRQDPELRKSRTI